jgi:dUTPase
MSWTGKLPEINVVLLPHGGKTQLTKGTGASIGYDVYLADTIIVPTFNVQNRKGQYEWEEVLPLSDYTTDQIAALVEDGVLCLPEGVGDELPKVLVGSKIPIVETMEKTPDKSFLISIRDGVAYVNRKRFNPLLFRTGFKIPPQRSGEDVWYALYPRSGVSIYYGCNLANGVGVIDPDYPDEILLALSLRGDVQQTFKKGERVAQLIVKGIVPSQINRTNEGYISPLDQMLEDYGGAITEWGAPAVRRGGYGSTGQ